MLLGSAAGRTPALCKPLRDKEDARKRAERELQADAPGAERVRRKQDRERSQQRRRAVRLAVKQRREQKQRRHQRRAHHGRRRARHDDKQRESRNRQQRCTAAPPADGAKEAQQECQMHPRDGNRMHDARIFERDIQVFGIQRLLFSEHERLGKGSHIRGERLPRTRNERVAQALRNVQPARVPDAGLLRRLTQIAVELHALGEIDVGRPAETDRSGTQLDPGADLIARPQVRRSVVVVCKARLSAGQLRRGDANRQARGIVIDLRVFCHAGGYDAFLPRDAFQRRDLPQGDRIP